ncbi:MAG: tail fiber domain-containing protein [Lachnospiraceae bacterium]|nr:tail fiber domain-containing protein [Lachnospiraceae bacterium]
MEWYPCSYSGGDWDSVLDIYNYSSKIGRINNQLQLKQGSYVAGGIETVPSDSYINFASIEIIGTYADYPCVFTISGRGREMPTMLSVFFNSVNSKDPSLNVLYKAYNNTYDIYIHKSAASKWDLYAPKSSNWGYVHILSQNCSGDHFKITHPYTQVSELPSNSITAEYYNPYFTMGNLAKNFPLVDSQYGGKIYSGYVRIAKLIFPGTSFNYERPFVAIALESLHGGQRQVLRFERAYTDVSVSLATSSSGEDFNYIITKISSSPHTYEIYSNPTTNAVRITNCSIFPYRNDASEVVRCDFTQLKSVTTIPGTQITPTQTYATLGVTNPSKEKTYLQVQYGGDFTFKNVGSNIHFKVQKTATENSIYNSVTGGTIGTANNKWNQFYAINSSISTSDRKEKEEISYMGKNSNYEDTYMSDEQLLNFILNLKPVLYKRIDGESGRPHHGFIAQDVEELLKRLEIKDHAGFIKSPKIETIEIEEEAEEEYVDETDGQTRTRTVIQKREEQR